MITTVDLSLNSTDYSWLLAELEPSSNSREGARLGLDDVPWDITV